MEKLSVSEVSKMVGKSARHIRNLCKEGKLPCQKIKITTGDKYLIYVDTEEFKNFLWTEGQDSDLVESQLDEGFNEEAEIPLPSSPSSSSGEWAEIVSSMTSKIEILAKEAGKTELLTDNLVTSNQNVKFYQDEYFKVRHELEAAQSELLELSKKNIYLEQKLKELQEELEKSKKPFWAKLSAL